MKSIKAGLSRSYQSLNNLNHADLSMDPYGGGDDTDSPTLSSPKMKKSKSNWAISFNRSKSENKSGEYENFRRGGSGKRIFSGSLRSVMTKLSKQKCRIKETKIPTVKMNFDRSWSIPEGDENGNRRDRYYNRSNMPSDARPAAAEHASLLGSFPDGGDGDVELRNVQLSMAHCRQLSEDGSAGERETVDTTHGPITVAVAGDRTKPVILTYHDLGLNHVTNFQAFLHYPDMRNLLNSFCIIHVNAPGQEEGAPTLPEGYVYPTMDELSETLVNVRTHFSIKTFIGLGVGLGANILARYAVKYPQDVDALLLINCSSTSSGWIEWGYQKMNLRQLRAGTMTTGIVEFLLWHHFGRVEDCNQDLVTVYRQHFEKSVNPSNLGMAIDAYIKRTDLGIVRELDINKKKDVQMIRCPVLNVTSNYSPHIEDTVTLNGRLDPSLSTWMKIQDCGLVIDEHPDKIVEAFKLFLQGLGYAIHIRKMSLQQQSSVQLNNGLNKDMRITENPLENPVV